MFSQDTAIDLILALQMAKESTRYERRRAGKPPMRTSVVKPVEQIEYGVDALNQVALLRTGFQDGSTQDLPISRTQIPEIMNFLKQAQQNFEAQDRARKQ